MASVILSSPTPPSPGGAGVWTTVSVPGGCLTPPVINSPNSPNTTISDLVCTGDYVFEYCVTNEGCAPVCDQVQISIWPEVVCNPGPDTGICGLLTTNMNAYPVGAGWTGLWTQVSGPSAGVFGSPTSPTSSFTVTAVGTYVLNWASTPNDPLNTCPPCNEDIIVMFQSGPTATIVTTPEVCIAAPVPPEQYCPNHCVASLNEGEPSGRLLNTRSITYVNDSYWQAPGPKTFGGWFQPECPLTQNGSGQELYTKGSISGGMFFQVTVTNAGLLVLRWRGSDGILNTLVGPAITCGMWQQINMRWNSVTNTVELVLNQNTVASAPVPSATSSDAFFNTGTLIFGGTNTALMYRGKIANVVAWNGLFTNAMLAAAQGTATMCPGTFNLSNLIPTMQSHLSQICNDGSLAMFDGVTTIFGQRQTVGTPAQPYFAQIQCCNQA